jgi:hypothetical protein
MTPNHASAQPQDANLSSEQGDRLRIRDAMDRLLVGTPLYSDGKLTIKSLADEAQVKRWLLTHKHVDLQDEFRARIAKRGSTPAAVQAVLDENAALTIKVTDLKQALVIEQETVKRLERVVQVLTVELDRLRHSFTSSNVRPLPKKPR